jgi:predicted HTH transcriptional regulator
LQKALINQFCHRDYNLHTCFICMPIERLRRGTRDMIELCKQAGDRPSKFEESTESFSVTFLLREPICSIVPTFPPLANLKR